MKVKKLLKRAKSSLEATNSDDWILLDRSSLQINNMRKVSKYTFLGFIFGLIVAFSYYYVSHFIRIRGKI